VRWLVLILILLWPAVSTADDVFDPLLEQLLRLPDHDARRATLVQKLGELGDDPLSKERLGTALSVLGALDADERTSEYVVRLFLGAAMDPDPEVRDDALLRARRNLGPPAGDDRPRTVEASRALLERRWLSVRTSPFLTVTKPGGEIYGPRFGSFDKEVLLSEFVALTGDDEILGYLQRGERRSWGVFGAAFGVGVGAGVAGGLTLVAATPDGLDGSGGGRIANVEAGRVVGGALIGLGVGAIVTGLVHRAAIVQRHAHGYRRYYTEERLRERVNAHNDKTAEELGVGPDASD